MTKEELADVLAVHGVPFGSWGTGEAKTLDHLLKEIEQHDSVLSVDGGVLKRVIHVAWIDVYYVHHGVILKLKEDYQEFNDGRKRNRNLSSSLGEKMKVGEDPVLATIRALKEELSVHVEPANIRQMPAPPVKTEQSPSFPGMMTQYTFCKFEVALPPEFFKPEGYVEVQDDKKTFFVWVEVPHA